MLFILMGHLGLKTIGDKKGTTGRNNASLGRRDNIAKFHIRCCSKIARTKCSSLLLVHSSAVHAPTGYKIISAGVLSWQGTAETKRHDFLSWPISERHKGFSNYVVQIAEDAREQVLIPGHVGT